MDYLSLQQGAGKIVRLSERMRDMARAQDWDALARLEQERQKSLESLFSHPHMPEGLEQIAEALQEVIELDRESIALSEKVKDDLGLALNRQSQGRRALRSYLRNSV